MARLCKRAASPYWQIESNGVRTSTKLRVASRDDTRAAHRLLAEMEEQEAKAVRHGGAAWGKWVNGFLTAHCVGMAGRSLEIYRYRWANVYKWLLHVGLRFPVQLKYSDVCAYLDWRVNDGVGRNTALQDIATLRQVMNEAVRRGFCLSNPAAGLRFKTAPRKEKPEITVEDEKVIREALKAWPQWMADAFEIGMATGRRISEIRIPLATVDLDAMTFLVKMKVGGVKGKPFHASLLPIFQRLKAEQAAYVYPVTPTKASTQFRRFFRKLGMPYTAHCFRVTFISRARRAGVDRWTVMEIVDHSSTAVHSIYSRYGQADLREGLDQAVSGQRPAQPPPLSSPPPSASPAEPRNIGHSETDQHP